MAILNTSRGQRVKMIIIVSQKMAIVCKHHATQLFLKADLDREEIELKKANLI